MKVYYSILFISMLLTNLYSQELFVVHDDLKNLKQVDNYSNLVFYKIEKQLLDKGFKSQSINLNSAISKKPLLLYYNNELSTKVFKHICTINYMLLESRISNGNLIDIDEWVFNNVKNAESAFNKITTFEENHIYLTIPSYYMYILFVNKIYKLILKRKQALNIELCKKKYSQFKRYSS